MTTAKRPTRHEVRKRRRLRALRIMLRQEVSIDRDEAQAFLNGCGIKPRHCSLAPIHMRVVDWDVRGRQ